MTRRLFEVLVPLVLATSLFAVRTEAADPLAIVPSTPKVAPLGSVTFAATGGSGSGLVWRLVGNVSGGTVDPATGVYRAGLVADVVDRVQVRDSAGAVALMNIDVGGALRIRPPNSALPPLGSATFGVSGGAGAYRWALVQSVSGGTIDPVTGFYRVGAVGSVTDRIRVTDSVNAADEIDVAIGPGITLTPESATAIPGYSIAFMVEGGSGRDYTWALDPNRSGATLSASGVYVGGGSVGVTDVLVVTDGLGNRGTASVAVVAKATPAPASDAGVPPVATASAAPRTSIVSIEGSGGFGCALSRSRSAPLLPVGGLLGLVALVSVRRRSARAARRSNEEILHPERSSGYA